MDDYLCLLFKTNNPIIKTKTIVVKRDLSIEDALLTFFRETFSIRTLDDTDLMFIYKGRILNEPKYLKKKINQLFHVNNCVITVKETGGIFFFN